MPNKIYSLLLLTSVLFVSGCGTAVSKPPAPQPAPADPSPLSIQVTQESASMDFDAAKQYAAILHTDKGNITVALNVGETPNTVKNFVDLARKDFYNGTIFHRVIKGFMIQGGDPNGDGTGDPGYRFDDEPFIGEYTRGTIAMANAGPNTNGSQFFIMHADYPLPKNYTVFGRVLAGMETVDKIAESQVSLSPSGEPSQPIEPTVVNSVEIQEQQ